MHAFSRLGWVLNVQAFPCVDIKAGDSHGSILAPFLFIIHVDDLTWGLSSNDKLLADDTSLCSIFYIIKTINNDWVEVNKWAYRWKTIFNSGPSKYTRRVIYSKRWTKETILFWFLNIDNVSKANSQKTFRGCFR